MVTRSWGQPVHSVRLLLLPNQDGQLSDQFGVSDMRHCSFLCNTITKQLHFCFSQEGLSVDGQSPTFQPVPGGCVPAWWGPSEQVWTCSGVGPGDPHVGKGVRGRCLQVDKFEQVQAVVTWGPHLWTDTHDWKHYLPATSLADGKK